MIHQHQLPNGLTLLAEPMDYVRSVTCCFMVPVGAASDPADSSGMAGVLSDMLVRGAGQRDSRELSQAFDNLGVDRGESVDTLNMWLTGSTLSRNATSSIDLFADVILNPFLPEDELEAAQALALQDIQALEDSPQEKVMLELRKRYLPPPLNADKLGSEAGIANITAASLKKHFQTKFRPNGAIFSFAGNFEWPQLKAQIERLFSHWKKQADEDFTPKPHKSKSEHIEKETQQTQIALAYPGPSIRDADYYAARGFTNVLSGGMSSRLFTEVREKRGLCYSVYAGHDTHKEFGTVLAYAGTRNERAQETLDVMLAELRKVKDGVTQDELDRVKAGLKSALIMRQESTSARAVAIASDWSLLERVRSFDEIQSAIDGLTTKQVADCAAKWNADSPTVLTLGPKPLKIS